MEHNYDPDYDSDPRRKRNEKAAAISLLLLAGAVLAGVCFVVGRAIYHMITGG